MRGHRGIRLGSANGLAAAGALCLAMLATPAAGVGATRFNHDSLEWNPTAALQGWTLLNGVDAVSSDDVWAVGMTMPGTMRETLIEHWDGTTWTRIPSPNPGNGGALDSVSALTADDAWAVGTYTPQGDTHAYALIEHWDGTSWSVASSDYQNAPYGNFLNDVVAIGADDAWAVGSRYPDDPDNPATLVEHWNGETWSAAASRDPQRAILNQLGGVTALTPHRVLAVGYSEFSRRFFLADHPLAEKWNGTRWRLGDPLRPGDRDQWFEDTSAMSTTSAWAVGAYKQAGKSTMMIQRLDGPTWTQAEVQPIGAFSDLSAVSALSESEAWATGWHSADGTTFSPLIEHWNGQAWSSVATHIPQNWNTPNISGVDSSALGDAWIVGSYLVGNELAAFIGHWDGHRWTITTI